MSLMLSLATVGVKALWKTLVAAKPQRSTSPVQNGVRENSVGGNSCLYLYHHNRVNKSPVADPEVHILLLTSGQPET